MTDLQSGPHADSADSEQKRYFCTRCGASSTLEYLFVGGGRVVRGNDKLCVTCSAYKERVSGVAKSVASGIAWSLVIGGALTKSPVGAAVFVVAMPLFALVSIVLHELGHAIATKVVGGRVVALSFGSGMHMKVVRRNHRFYLFGLRPIEGLTVISDVPKAGYRWRMVLIFFAGPAANFTVAAVSWVYYTGTTFNSVLVDSLVFFWAFVNTLAGLINLYPFSGSNSLGAMASDGQQILAHIAMSDDDVDLANRRTHVSEAHLEWLYGDVARAASLIEDEIAETPIDPAIAVMGSAVMLSLRRYDDGIDICERALADEPEGEMRAILENNLACLLLGRGDENDIERIDRLSSSAMEVLPMMLAVRSTRGTYYLQAGESLKALELLDDERYVLEAKRSQGEVAVNIALAYVNLGRIKAARKALDKAAALYPDNQDLPKVEEAILAVDSPAP